MIQLLAQEVSNFGISPMFFLAQLINLAVLVVYFVMIVKATLLAAREGEGINVPIWIIAIAFVPILGAVGAFAHFKNGKS